MSKQLPEKNEPGSYAQLYLYRIPKKNHNAMVSLQGQIGQMWKRHGILGAEVFQLTPAETFKGFSNLSEKIAAEPNEEVWVGMQRFRDREHRDEIVAKIRQDSTAGPLFGKFYELVSPGKSSVMADFNRLSL